jgi:hypothetical protein
MGGHVLVVRRGKKNVSRREGRDPVGLNIAFRLLRAARESRILLRRNQEP